MHRKLILAGFLALGAGAGLAHQGVQNPAVMARMMLMEKIGNETKTLVQMARGQTPFDAGVA